MQFLHNAPFSDPDGGSQQDVMRALVKHFADTQGLAPEESARYRYMLERRLDVIDLPEDPEYTVMCTRCHSEARVGLQRRSEEEWRHLVHFHLAQFPTTEYQAGGRDRDWIGTALNRTVPMLAGRYPLESEAWSKWQAASKPELDGRWRLAGHMPGKGAFDGIIVAKAADGDRLELEMRGQFADGEPLEGSGRAQIYTGYEWRGALDAGDTRYRQVFAANAAGTELRGRMYLDDHEESGIDIHAVKDGGQTAVIAVYPPNIRAGSEQLVTVVGLGLSGKPQLGPGIRVSEVLSQDKDRVVVKAAADGEAAEGARQVSVGKATLPDALTVYRRIDRIEVAPAYAIGRVGDAGGSQPKEYAIFEALAFGAGPDGTSGTEDDLPIGVVPAEWSVEPWDEKAASDGDVRFAGQMDKDSGVFTPAEAGPNPARKYGTNNAGNLKVVASVREGDSALRGEGRLLVTVQRWNNPPIR
jgi:quinohemoprotein amine dehydrogenase